MNLPIRSLIYSARVSSVPESAGGFCTGQVAGGRGYQYTGQVAPSYCRLSTWSRWSPTLPLAPAPPTVDLRGALKLPRRLSAGKLSQVSCVHIFILYNQPGGWSPLASQPSTIDLLFRLFSDGSLSKCQTYFQEHKYHKSNI